jgi:hypothetical protein
MTDATTQNTEEKKGVRPNFRAWLVQDTEEGEPRWTELSGLWPTKSGAGFKGALRTPLAATTGRLVILPATFKPGKEG